MNAGICILFLTIQLTYVLAATTPYQKCDISDAACTKQSAQSFIRTFAAGLPEYGTEQLDILHVDEIKFEFAGLILNMNNIDIKGLKKTVIDSLNIDMSKKQMHLVYHADIHMKGQYKAGGRLLVLPITGDGDMDVKLKNLNIDLTIPFKIVKNKDGNEIMELTSYKYKYEVKENVNFQLTNLFNGNKLLSDAMLSFMNGNWKTMMEEFGRPVLETPIKKIFTAIKIYLKAQPLENIANY